MGDAGIDHFVCSLEEGFSVNPIPPVVRKDWIVLGAVVLGWKRVRVEEDHYTLTPA